MAEKKKIFISYKRNVEPDEPIALEIFSQLSQEHDVFIDLKIMVGTKWSKEIRDNLLTSDFFISLISGNSIKSDMVSTEIQMAYKHARTEGKPVILPVRLNYFEDLEYDLTAYLDSRNYLAWRSYSDTQNIIKQLKQVIDGQRLSNDNVFDLIKQRVKDKEILVRRLLSSGDFQKAIAECEIILEQNSDAHLIHLTAAIAMLKGKGAGTFPTSFIKRIEKHLDNASKNQEIKSTALVIWGIVKHDHYVLHGLYQGEPSLESIRRSLNELGLETVDVDLIELVRTDQITLKALGLQEFFKNKS
jgi:hypothetical protein